MLGPLYGNTKKRVRDAVQVTGSEKMNSENVAEVLKCNMFGGQNKKVVRDKCVFDD